MKTVFADTFFYIAFFNPRDKANEQAYLEALDPTRRILTTEYVLIELLDAFSATKSRKNVAAFVRELLSDQQTKVIPASKGLFAEALQLYHGRPDKSWSFTDCASFIVMKEHGVTDALTGDIHFQQAGFHPVLRP